MPTRIVLIFSYERDDVADLNFNLGGRISAEALLAPPGSQACSAHAPESLRLEDTIVYVTTMRLSKRFP
jgi:hypothetical protein